MSASPSPYRTPAAPAADATPALRRWIRRGAGAFAMILAVSVASLLLVRSLPWAPRAARLRVAREALPPGHSPMRGAAWTDEGGALAVGARGEIYARPDPGTAWQRVASGTDAGLLAVGAGVLEYTYVRHQYGDTFHWPDGPTEIHELMSIVVGERGTLVGCGESGCAVVDSGTTETLRAVTFVDGAALAVGDAGVSVKVYRRTHDERYGGPPADDALHAVEEEHIGGTSASLRAIDAIDSSDAPRAAIGAATVPLDTGGHVFVAGVEAEWRLAGAATLLLDDAGDVYSAF